MTWVFGYGSLMWRPGFSHDQREAALLRGYHRRYCLISTRGRGTPETPGMMLGLLPGGTCTGVAYRVTPGRETEALAYLDERENEGSSNRRVLFPVQILSGGGAALESAWAFLPMVSGENYVGAIAAQTCARNIAAGAGKRGTALEYLRSMLAEVTALGAEEPRMEALLREVERVAGDRGGAPAAARGR